MSKLLRAEALAASEALWAQWLELPGNRGEFQRALRGATGKRITLLKEQHCNLVYVLLDMAHDVRHELSPDDIRGTFTRVQVPRGFTRVPLSVEAAKWIYEQQDAVMFTIAREVLVTSASNMGVTLDRKLTVY